MYILDLFFILQVLYVTHLCQENKVKEYQCRTGCRRL